MESRRFDQLTVSVATGASRRRVLASLGAITMGTLLGRPAEAKPSSSKGKSGTNDNSDCNAVCAHEVKQARKDCKKKDNKSDKKGCLKGVKKDQAKCRAECVPSDNTGTGSTPVDDTGSNAGDPETGGDFSILAQPVCDAGTTSADCPMCAAARTDSTCCLPGGGEQDCGRAVNKDCTVANQTHCSGTCVTATCTTGNGDNSLIPKPRCNYAENGNFCTGKGTNVCCARFTSKNFGKCVKGNAQC